MKREYVIIATVQSIAIVLMFAAIITLMTELNKPHWACAAEDEVLIIDNTCVHVDKL